MNKVQFTQDDDIIDPCRDNVFKAVFTKDTSRSREALSRLISALIGTQVATVTVIANEPPVHNLNDRQIRFDIRCKADTGELFDIEMTLHPDAYEILRLEFYGSRLFTEQDIRGSKKSYRDLRKAYQISLIRSRIVVADDAFFHEFEYYDKERRISLGGMSRIITVELEKLGGIAEKPVAEMSAAERWGIFFRYCTDKEKRGLINEILVEEEGIGMAAETVVEISRDEIERAQQDWIFKNEMDYQSGMVGARREGEEIGFSKGLTEGKEQGLEQGAYQEKLETARKLKRRGLAVWQIAEDTGLSSDEVEKL
jgi:predicted transposase/invertase (TIGR01784 family)